ncbi:MAG: PEGA domain-containing protein [Lentisphaeria bacterium]|nr:PEGA domain-containing protein [Lentisphaeria bacterium]
MKLRFMKGRMSGHMVDVLPTGFVVGRGPSCDLVIDEDGISRRHARLFFEDGTWFVEDLGSTNGVRVNGTKVAGRFCIKNGDRIGLFNQTLLFTDDSEVVDIDTLAGSPTAVLPAPSPKSAPSAAVPGQPPSPTPSQSTMNGVKIIVLLVLVAGLAWLAKETIKGGRGAAGDESSAVESVDDESSMGGGVDVTVDDESPAIVIEIPGMDDTEPVVKPVEIVQVDVIDGVPAVVIDGAVRREAADVFIESVPPGAAVSLDGVARGIAPVMLRDVPAGDHDLTLSLAGYEPLPRKLLVPEGVPDRPFTLRVAAGAVRVTSDPVGATVLHGTQVLGTTPFVTMDLPPGNQELRIVKYGFEPQRKTVMVSTVEGADVTVTLNPLMGAMELVTVPAGCNVYIDNVFKGKTPPPPDRAAGTSAPLRITGLKEGDHQARVEHLNGAAKNAVVTVKRGGVGTAFVELWVADTKVTLRDGAEKFGMLLGVNADGDVALSEKTPGIKGAQTNTYVNERVLKTEALSPTEGRMKTAQILAAETAAARENGDTPGGVDDGADLDAGKIVTYTAETLNTLIAKMGAIALSKRVGAREVVFTGVPTAIDADHARAQIHFGDTIICEMPREDYDRVGHEIRHARESDTAITMRGKMVANTRKAVTLLHCVYQAEED